MVFSSAAKSGEAGSRTWKVDRAILDLDDDVRVEFAVQIDEIVVGGAGAVVFRIVPIHVMVVDEAAVEQQAVVRLEGAGHYVGGVGVGSSADDRRANGPSESGFMTTPARSGTAE